LLDTIVKPQERLTVWRNFKKQNLDTNKILRYISSNKTIDRTFDFYTPKYWPTGWEIISEKMFCHSGKAILLHETLVHMGKINPKDTYWFVADNFEFGQVGLAFSNGLCYYNILPNQTVKRVDLDNYIRVLEKINHKKKTITDNESNEEKWTQRRLKH
tara:strand:+ start:4341 stop:4814 length:474 start_codon:yes stop_codon:yes gene_type:complete